MNWVATLFPVLELPDDLLHADDRINAVFAMGDGLGPWADWGALTALAAVPLTIWVGGLVVMGVRSLVRK